MDPPWHALCLAMGCGSCVIPVIMTFVDPEQERQRLTELYARMSKGELRQLHNEAESMTEVAGQALRSEIERRSLGTCDSKTGADDVEFRELILIRQYMNLPQALLA